MNWTLFVDRMVEQPWIESGADAAEGRRAQFFEAWGSASVPVRNFLHGVWLGHPLHPVITDIVVGALHARRTGRGRGGRRAKQIAPANDIALATGIVERLWPRPRRALPTGMCSKGTPKRIGFLHMLFNLSATVLYIASLIARKVRQPGAGPGAGLDRVRHDLRRRLPGRTPRLRQEHRRRSLRPDGSRRTSTQTVMPEADLAPGRAPQGDAERDAGGVASATARAIAAMSDSCAHQGCSLAEMGELEDDSIRCTLSRFALSPGRRHGA